MLSNCNSTLVRGGLTSTPTTEKLPRSGRSREPKLPEIPVTTTTGLAISSVLQPALAPAVVLAVEPEPLWLPGDPWGWEPFADSACAAAAHLPLRDQSKLRWFRL